MDVISEFLRLSDLSASQQNGFQKRGDSFSFTLSPTGESLSAPPSPNERVVSESRRSSNGLVPEYSVQAHHSPFIPVNQQNQSIPAEQLERLLGWQTSPANPTAFRTPFLHGGGNVTLWSNQGIQRTPSFSVPIPTSGVPSGMMLVPMGSSSSSGGVPQMPSAPLEASGSGGRAQGRKSSQNGDRRNSQRQKDASGPLSSHAIYARMNRERKKKYLADLEEYRVAMKKKRVEDQKTLENLRKETETLTTEINNLRSTLQRNETLMSLLSMGKQKK